MAKWAVFAFFWIVMTVSLSQAQLWTWWILIPVFTVLYNWAESLEYPEAPLQDRTHTHYIEDSDLQNH